MEEGMDEFAQWRADLDQAEATAKDVASIVATMYKSLRTNGLGLHEAVFLAAAWVWNASRPHPSEDDPHGAGGR